jgi:hypothetical protein
VKASEAMTDDEILKNREELQRRLPPDIRTDAANNHVDAYRTAKEILPDLYDQGSTGERRIETAMYHSFLAGWDAAMEIRSEELLDEHYELHGRIMDIEMEKLRKERGI